MPLRRQSQQLRWYPQGEVGNEGCLGQFHIEGDFLGLVCTIDSPRGDDIVSKAGGHLAADLGTVDLNAINHLWERWAGITGGDQPECTLGNLVISLAASLPNAPVWALKSWVP